MKNTEKKNGGQLAIIIIDAFHHMAKILQKDLEKQVRGATEEIDVSNEALENYDRIGVWY